MLGSQIFLRRFCGFDPCILSTEEGLIMDFRILFGFKVNGLILSLVVSSKCYFTSWIVEPCKEFVLLTIFS